MSDQEYNGINQQVLTAPNSSNKTPNEPEKNDEISLLDLMAVLVKRKWLIIIITGLAAFGSVAYAVGSLLLPPDKSYLPNVYTPKAMMLISSGSSSSLSSLLASSGLSSIASAAGVSGANPNQQLAQVLATSNTTLDRLNQKFDFVAHYKMKDPKVGELRKAISSNLSAKTDEKSNIFTISFTDKDPVLPKK